jgi:hypothetical protein
MHVVVQVVEGSVEAVVLAEEALVDDRFHMTLAKTV